MSQSLSAEDQLYEILKNQQKTVSDRNALLTKRAKELLDFTGIINTVLVVLITSALDSAKMEHIKRLTYFPNLRWIVPLGFVSYIISTFLFLLAYREKKYFPAPRIESIDYIKAVFGADDSIKLNKIGLANQLFQSIQYYNTENKKKYRYLIYGVVCYSTAIIFTTLTGILLFLSIATSGISQAS